MPVHQTASLRATDGPLEILTFDPLAEINNYLTFDITQSLGRLPSPLTQAARSEVHR